MTEDTQTSTSHSQVEASPVQRSKMWPGITIEHLWLGIPVFVLLWKSFLFQFPVLDFWWHLKMGEVIATTGEIPRVDLFSFTAAGQPFVVQNWLAELSYYAVYTIGGLPLIAFGNALLILAAFLPIYAVCRAATTNLRIGVTVATLAAGGFLATIRPQAFSFVMFALFYWLLARYRDQHKDLLWTLPILMALWVNLHGAFILGLGLIGVFFFSEGTRRLINPARTDALSWNQLRKLAVVLLLCALASLANPEGYRVYDYVQTVMNDPSSRQLVVEWQPPRIDDASGIVLFYGPFFLAVLVFAYARSKPDFTEMTLFLVFAFLGITALRNGQWFSMITYPMIARYLPTVSFAGLLPLRRIGVIDGFIERIQEHSADRPHYYRINLLLASIAVVILVMQSPWLRPTLYKTSLLEEQTPVGAAEFIDRQNLEGNMFHPQIFGDYLIWRLWPEQKSFVDGRVHLFGLDFVHKYLLVYQDLHWESVLDQWDIRYLLLSKSSNDDSSEILGKARHSGHWAVLYEDEISVLLEKKID